MAGIPKDVSLPKPNIVGSPRPHPGGPENLDGRLNWTESGAMKGADLKEVVEREPFRPFIVRLNNGARYTFKTARNIGASLDYGMIFSFGEPRGAVRIDSDSIVEIIGGELPGDSSAR
jgi:hypothetical protein